MPGRRLYLPPGALMRPAYSGPNVRIVIKELNEDGTTVARSALSLAAVAGPGGRRLRLQRGRRLRRRSTPTTPRRWPARRPRSPPCTGRRTSCCRAASMPIEERIAALRGYPVVVNVWASWCGPCRFEFPTLQKLSAAYGKRVAFLGIDSQDSDDAANDLPRRGAGPLPQLHRPRQRHRRRDRRRARPPRHRLLRPRRRARLPQTGPLRRHAELRPTSSATRSRGDSAKADNRAYGRSRRRRSDRRRPAGRRAAAADRRRAGGARRARPDRRRGARAAIRLRAPPTGSARR